MTICNNFFFRRITKLLRPASVLILAGCALWLGLQCLVNQPKTIASASAFDAGSRPSSQPTQGCDMEPTGVETINYWLHFNIEPGLMPDKHFDRKPANLHVHRVRPVYAQGKCPGVPNRAIVLIHGRSAPGPVVFDTRHRTAEDPEGGKLSIQESLARAGINTFAPSLLGYGLSTRFDQGLDDPCNASLPAYNKNGSCSPNKRCDRSSNTIIFPLNQQAIMLGVNPLAGRMCKHSSEHRFARTDVWANDVIRVIDDAIARAQPDNSKVVLVGSSLGGVTVARALYKLGDQAQSKVERIVFQSSLFDRLLGPNGEMDATLPTEEAPDADSSTTFPMALFSSGIPPQDPPGCGGKTIPGLADDVWEQLMQNDVLGSQWGVATPGRPPGLLRAPTFSSYGWNTEVAASSNFTIPTLVLHGLNDGTSPPSNSDHIYHALTRVTNKVLVQVKCTGHSMFWEGCSGPRCDNTGSNSLPYGGDSPIWAGPYSTINAALIEWVKHGTFNGASNGRFVINESGIVTKGVSP